MAQALPKTLRIRVMAIREQVAHPQRPNAAAVPWKVKPFGVGARHSVQVQLDFLIAGTAKSRRRLIARIEDATGSLAGGFI
jgi:hypothetical protein